MGILSGVFYRFGPKFLVVECSRGKKKEGGGWKWSHLTMYILPRDRINITLSPLQKRLLPTQAYVGPFFQRPTDGVTTAQAATKSSARLLHTYSSLRDTSVHRTLRRCVAVITAISLVFPAAVLPQRRWLSVICTRSPNLTIVYHGDNG